MRLWQNVDWTLLGLTLLAAVMGLVAVAGVSGTSLHDPAVVGVLQHQLAYTLMGLCALTVLALVDYHAWARWAKALYAFLIVVLVVTWRLGHHTLGAARWIRIGHLEIQPSELGKLLLILWLATLLAPQAGQIRRWRTALLAGAYTALPALLVALQPDLGTSLVFAAVLVGVLYAGGFPGTQLALAVACVVGLAVGGVVAHVRWHLPIPIQPYQLDRLLSFLNPQVVAQSSGYQVIQSEVTIGSGRLFGTGLFSMGVNNQLHWLPESNSDFIFASIGSTVGFVGACAVLLVLGAIVWRTLHCMAGARDGLGALLTGGIAAMLAAQTLLNAGVALGLLPLTGVPLPFFSVGGSAALTNFAALGLVQSVYMRRKKIQF